MAWIEAHQELPRHPKTKRFARMLKISIPQAVGHLFMFWWWALDYAENGDLSRYDAYDLADAAQWEGDPEEFLNAMIECGPGDSYGFIEKNDSGLFVHDWEFYSGRLVEKREKNRQRQAQGRKNKTAKNLETTESTKTKNKKKSVTRDKRVTKRNVARESQGYTTQQNRTQHNTTGHDTTQQQPPLSPTPRPKAAAAAKAVTLAEIVKLWNQTLTPRGFSHVLKQTPSRERALQSLLATSTERHELTWWQELFDKIGASSFLCRSVQERNWCTLDWVLNESNLVKILEGRYDDREYSKPQPQQTPQSQQAKTPDKPSTDKPLTIDEIMAKYRSQNPEQSSDNANEGANFRKYPYSIAV
ncbi:MAG: hypothetical protein IJS40_08445 [Synergistaceae bacterium]|nr:hypothetical protein [Synergistaceae bacterium]